MSNVRALQRLEMLQAPKYPLPEIERRWLVEANRVPPVHDVRRREIEDKYIQGGRLRLRVVRSPGDEPVYKLGKKYPQASLQHENVVSLYLSLGEYTLLQSLPGATVQKARYSVAGGSLDLYESSSGSPVIFEVEFPSEEAAALFVPLPFVGKEVTFNAEYSGFALAQAAP